jgi:hypothetical protein
MDGMGIRAQREGMASDLAVRRTNDLESIRRELVVLASHRRAAAFTGVEQDWYDRLCRRERELLGWPKSERAAIAKG